MSSRYLGSSPWSGSWWRAVLRVAPDVVVDRPRPTSAWTAAAGVATSRARAAGPAAGADAPRAARCAPMLGDRPADRPAAGHPPVEGPAAGPPLATSRLVGSGSARWSPWRCSPRTRSIDRVRDRADHAGAGGRRGGGDRLAFPVALGIEALLAILVLSYRSHRRLPVGRRRLCRCRDNFGPRWALVAGSALLVDYVLTVAVSVAGGRPHDRLPCCSGCCRCRWPRSGYHPGQPPRGAGVGPHLRGADLPVRRLLRGDAAGRPGPPGRGHLDPIPAAGTARCRRRPRRWGRCWCCTPSPPAAPP